LLDKIRTGQSDLGSKLLWRKDSRRLYVQAIEACYLQKDMAGAFYFFEKSRAVVLNDQLAQQHWLSSADISKRVQLNKKIVSLQAEASVKETIPKDMLKFRMNYLSKHMNCSVWRSRSGLIVLYITRVLTVIILLMMM
jgi:hypothetical protein